MFKRLKELVQPLMKVYQPGKEKFTISFKKEEENANIHNGTPDKSTCGEENDIKGGSFMWLKEDKLYSVIADKALLHLSTLVPDIINSDDLSNLTDLRTTQDLFSTQDNNEEYELKPRCREEPKPFVFKEFNQSISDVREEKPKMSNLEAIQDYYNYKSKEEADGKQPQQSITKNTEQILKKLIGPEELTIKMNEILWDMLEKRDLEFKGFKRTEMDFNYKYNVETIIQRDKKLKLRIVESNIPSDVGMKMVLSNTSRILQVHLGSEKNMNNKKKTENKENEIKVCGEMDVYSEIVKRYFDRRQSNNKVSGEKGGHKREYDPYTELLKQYYDRQERSRQIREHDEKKEYDAYTDMLKKYYIRQRNPIDITLHTKREVTDVCGEMEVYTEIVKRYLDRRQFNNKESGEKGRDKREYDPYTELLKQYYDRQERSRQLREHDEKTEYDVYTELLKKYHIRQRNPITLHTKREEIDKIKSKNVWKINHNLVQITSCGTIYRALQEDSYINSMIHINRSLENKINSSKQLRVKTSDTPLNLKTEFKKEDASAETIQLPTPTKE